MKLDNIAAINKALYERFNSVNDDENSKQESLTPILIIYPCATPLPIQIMQPQNTFIALLVAKNAKIDCSNFILNQCEILYLDYDESNKETHINPRATNLKTNNELILSSQDSNTYEARKDNILYFIDKKEGILKIALNDKKDEAIELYNFAKENKYHIIKDKVSKIFDIQLKLSKDETLTTKNDGNFTLSVTNLVILDKNRNSLSNERSNTIKAYLHNCENRIIL